MKSDKNLEDKCFFHEVSRRIRAEECNSMKPKVVTYNFQKLGCYDCSGYNFRCKSYLTKKDAESYGKT